jgi:hypothetical protein
MGTRRNGGCVATIETLATRRDAFAGQHFRKIALQAVIQSGLVFLSCSNIKDELSPSTRTEYYPGRGPLPRQFSAVAGSKEWICFAWSLEFPPVHFDHQP